MKNAYSICTVPIRSNYPLLPGEIFNIRLEELEEDETEVANVVYIGLTNIDPSSSFWESARTVYANVDFETKKSDIFRVRHNGTIKKVHSLPACWRSERFDQIRQGVKIGIVYFNTDEGETKIRVIVSFEGKKQFATICTNSIITEKPIHVVVYGRFRKIVSCTKQHLTPFTLRNYCRGTILQEKIEYSSLPQILIDYVKR